MLGAGPDAEPYAQELQALRDQIEPEAYETLMRLIPTDG